MSEENKCVKNEACCDGTKKLSQEELEQAVGGHAMGPNVAGVIGSAVAAGIVLKHLDEK